ncbi:MAG: DUF3783 domain-containing protein [Acutalibacteraceae bacterium]
MRETVLLYHFEDKNRLSEVRIALMPLKLYVQEIEKQDYEQPIGIFAGVSGISRKESADCAVGNIENEMLVLCGLTERKLDRVLQALKRRKLVIPYKAVLTDTNKSWSGTELYNEIVKEHQQMTNA